MAVSPQPSPLERAFTGFGVLWAASAIFNNLVRFDLRAGADVFALQAATIAAAFALLVRPSSLGRFLLLAATYAAAAWVALPQANNHGILILVLHLAVLCAWVGLAARRRRLPERAELYRVFVPVARASLVALYFWATIHKLNSGFLAPAISCASTELTKLRELSVFGVSLDFFPAGDLARVSAIWGTIAIEGAIPLLLLSSRTRTAGVALAALFHLLLGLSYAAFSAMLYALLALFLPLAFWTELERAWQRSPTRRLLVASRLPRVWPYLRAMLDAAALVFLAWALAVAAELPFTRTLPGPAAPDALLFPSFWLAWGGTLAGVFATIVVARRPRPGADELAVVPRGALALFVLAVFLNGLAPYVGLKSTLSYAMYSNLRTEDGGTNHLFLPASLQVFDHQRDLVTIHASSDPVLDALSRPSWAGAPGNPTFVTFIRPSHEQLAGPPPSWKLPYLALRQRVTELARAGETGIYLVYERGGAVHRVARAEEDPELASLPYLPRKLLRLRAVPSIEAGCCMW